MTRTLITNREFCLTTKTKKEKARKEKKHVMFRKLTERGNGERRTYGLWPSSRSGCGLKFHFQHFLFAIFLIS